MRNELKPYRDQRHSFTATVKEFGMSYFKDHEKPTVLLVNICLGDKQVADHVWMELGKRLDGMRIGDRIQFDARVARYAKGYVNLREGIDNRTFDFKLNNPTRITVMPQDK